MGLEWQCTEPQVATECPGVHVSERLELAPAVRQCSRELSEPVIVVSGEDVSHVVFSVSEGF
jgi:hypothetical protein